MGKLQFPEVTKDAWILKPGEGTRLPAAQQNQFLYLLQCVSLTNPFGHADTGNGPISNNDATKNVESEKHAV